MEVFKNRRGTWVVMDQTTPYIYSPVTSYKTINTVSSTSVTLIAMKIMGALILGYICLILLISL